MSFLAVFFLLLFGYPMFKLYSFFHELSHALVGLILTRDRVTMYIGSYGDQKNNISFNTGLLEWRIRYNFFNWHGGMCVMHAKDVSSNVRILYILAGSVLPFVVALGLYFSAFMLDAPMALTALACAFWLITFYFLIYSLSASSDPVKLNDGSLTYNDGQMIRQQLAYQRAKVFYDQGGIYYQQNAYDSAIKQFELAIREEPQNGQSYELLMNCWLQKKEFAKAKEIAVSCVKNCPALDDHQYVQIAYVYSSSGEHERSLHYYSLALKKNPNNSIAWYNKGCLLNFLGYYEKAIPSFEKAILLNPKYASAYNEQGFAYMKTGDWEEALRRIKHALRLDDRNAYAYRNLGVYHLQKLDYTEALRLFKKAKYIDSTTSGINELIERAEAKGKVSGDA